jgi:RNA polymerase sigma factor (sigma-70 family)
MMDEMVEMAHSEPVNDGVSARTDRGKRLAVVDGGLGRYYRDMGQYALLRREDEAEAGRRVQEADRALWQRVLARAGVLPAIVAAIRERALDLPSPVAALRQSRTRADLEAAADALRELDPDRDLAFAVLHQLEEDVRRRPSAALSALCEDARRLLAVSTRERNAMAAANLRLVAKVAREFDYTRTALEDRIQEGNLGMLRAVGRFDYRHGVRFATYAVWWVRNAIWRFATGKDKTIRIPAHVRSEGYKVLSADEQLTAALGRSPSVEEVAVAVDLPVERVHELQRILTSQAVSIDHGAHGADDDKRLIDRIEDRDPEQPSFADDLVRREELALVLELAGDLPELELAVLQRRFGLDGNGGATLAEVGEELSLSRERIRQIQNQAVARLRRMIQRSVRPDAAVA